VAESESGLKSYVTVFHYPIFPRVFHDVLSLDKLKRLVNIGPALLIGCQGGLRKMVRFEAFERRTCARRMVPAIMPTIQLAVFVSVRDGLDGERPTRDEHPYVSVSELRVPPTLLQTKIQHSWTTFLQTGVAQ
jgi:hypothetical protein